LNAEPPVYAHVPLILDEHGKKLSKRTGAAAVMDYRDMGFLPEAVLNYLVRLGWSHGDQEIFSIYEMVTLFDIDDINSATSIMNPIKMLWLIQHYIKTSDPKRAARHLAWYMGELGIDPAASGPALEDVAAAL